MTGKLKVTIPHIGRYTKLIEEFVNDLGWDAVLPPSPSERTTELGAKYMNELMCLPAKVTLGGFIEAADKGLKNLLMFDSCGQCRLKSYWVLQQRALDKLGYKVTVYPLTLGRGTARDIRRVDQSVPYWKAWWVTLRFMQRIRQVDRQVTYEILDKSEAVKIGIVGEIYTMLEPAVNKRLVEKLEKMGVLLHNSLPLSYFIFKRLYQAGWMKRGDMDEKVLRLARKMGHQYFPKEIGGHGNESIVHSIYYALKKFDGVIHVLPFPCMPESTVATIIDDISQDFGIPVMRLIFDTHTGEAGLNTRLEAFVDILKRRKARFMSKG